MSKLEADSGRALLETPIESWSGNTPALGDGDRVDYGIASMELPHGAALRPTERPNAPVLRFDSGSTSILIGCLDLPSTTPAVEGFLYRQEWLAIHQARKGVWDLVCMSQKQCEGYFDLAAVRQIACRADTKYGVYENEDFRAIAMVSNGKTKISVCSKRTNMAFWIRIESDSGADQSALAQRLVSRLKVGPKQWSSYDEVKSAIHATRERLENGAASSR
jgi:hypothetical protein